MDDDISPAVERALSAAAAWARRLGAAAIEPRHMLLGLLDDDEGAVSRLLGDAGLDVESWRKILEAQSGTATEQYPPRSQAVRQSLLDAQALAREHGAEKLVTSDLTALALLQIDGELAAELVVHGLRIEKIQERMATPTEQVPLAEPLDLEHGVDWIDAARILDAAANRAREALRVLEDYARFSRDDAALTADLKGLRHDLTGALDELPPGLLLTARDTENDVGTAITTERESTRRSLADVVAANAKRLQEALRSLEEYGKLYGSHLGQRFERLRYRSYTLERSLRRHGTERPLLAEARLYVLLSGADLERMIVEVAAGGADIIQLREKKLSDRELLARAAEVRRWTERAGVLFIMNDRPDIARLVGADGVHLGQDDMTVREARRIVGPDLLIGVSTHNIEQVRRAELDGADYLGVGPVFASPTKEFEALAGLEFVRAAAAATSLPAFVLGGITVDNVRQVVDAGGRRVAVSSAIAQTKDPRAVAAALRAALD